MRIISGTKKGFRLTSFKNRSIRPTADSTKELIFNVLKDIIEDSFVLDIYAGTGSLGIEALSRGAAKAIFIENNSSALKILQSNLAKTEFLNVAEVIRISAKQALKMLSGRSLKFDLIFADPPYGDNLSEETLLAVEKNDLLSEGGWIIIEHVAKSKLRGSTRKYTLKSNKKQGDSEVSFYRYEK